MPTSHSKDCLQDNFLDTFCEAKSTVAIYLTNGIKLQGRVDSFDQNVVIIKNENSTLQMIYKHAISTIMPAVAIVRYNDRTATTGGKEKGTEDVPVTNAE